MLDKQKTLFEFCDCGCQQLIKRTEARVASTVRDDSRELPQKF